MRTPSAPSPHTASPHRRALGFAGLLLATSLGACSEPVLDSEPATFETRPFETRPFDTALSTPQVVAQPLGSGSSQAAVVYREFVDRLDRGDATEAGTVAVGQALDILATAGQTGGNRNATTQVELIESASTGDEAELRTCEVVQTLEGQTVDWIERVVTVDLTGPEARVAQVITVSSRDTSDDLCIPPSVATELERMSIESQRMVDRALTDPASLDIADLELVYVPDWVEQIEQMATSLDGARYEGELELTASADSWIPEQVARVMVCQRLDDGRTRIDPDGNRDRYLAPGAEHGMAVSLQFDGERWRVEGALDHPDGCAQAVPKSM